jgi:hypothetical protein
LREEPSLGGTSAQFDDEHLIGVWRRVGRAARRAVRFELVHQHGLPHPAVAVDDQGRHSRGARMLEQLVQVVENVDGFWIGDPALRLDKIDPLINGTGKDVRPFICQMAWFEHQVAVPKAPVRSVCASRCRSSIPNRSRPRLFLTVGEFSAPPPSWRSHRRQFGVGPAPFALAGRRHALSCPSVSALFGPASIRAG